MARIGEPFNPDAKLAEVARLAWHDATCPESGDCRDRDLHAESEPVVVAGVLDKVVEAVLPWAGLVLHERARLLAMPYADHPDYDKALRP